MRKYDGIPELLEQFMREQSADERWMTVQELRDRYSLTRYQCNTVSGFLRRLHTGTFGQCPFIVARIEPAEGVTLSGPPKNRYLVKRKDGITAKTPVSMHHAVLQVCCKADGCDSG
jgi:hypothetical protein